MRPDVASAQLAAERKSRGEGEVAGVAGAGVGGGDGPEVGPPKLRRFYGVVSVDAERLGRDAGRIGQEVLAHLNGLVGTDVEVTIEVRAANDDGFDEAVVRTVSENADALRFHGHGFEHR